EHDVDVHAALLGLDQRLGNRLGGKRIGQHQDLTPGALDLRDQGFSATTLGGEEYGYRKEMTELAFQRTPEKKQRPGAGKAGRQQHISHSRPPVGAYSVLGRGERLTRAVE